MSLAVIPGKPNLYLLPNEAVEEGVHLFAHRLAGEYTGVWLHIGCHDAWRLMIAVVIGKRLH